MLIQHKQTGNGGVFFVPGDEDDMLAELVYKRVQDDRMIIEHTGVSDELRGENIGLQLVESAVEYARTHHLTVVPLCSFAKAIIHKRPEMQDVLG